MDKLEVSPQSVRGYGNIIIPKLSTDFVGKYNEIYTDEDGYFVLSYGGVMLKASATVSNTIKGIQASLTVLVSTRDSDTPVSGLSVDCSVDEVALTGKTTDSTGKCTFTWTPSDLGDSSLLISISPQDDYAGLSLDKTVTVGLLLGFDGIMTSLSLEDDEVYTGTFEEQVEDRSQLSEFVKDVWVASGGEPIVDEYGIIHLCEPGDLVVESEGLEQLSEYSNVLFEEDVDLLTGAVYDMSISEDYEIVLGCLERDDIVPDVPPVPPSYDGISLSSDESILSYADGDTCTLTAQLTDDGSPVSVEGVTVEFFNGSTSLGTADTNSSGVATKTYASAGSGDMTLTAGVDSIISSETLTIQDILKYDDCSSDKSSSYDLNSYGNGTITYDGTNKCYQLNAESGHKGIIVSNVSTTKNVQIDVDIKINATNNQQIVVGSYNPNQGKGVGACSNIVPSYNQSKVGIRNNFTLSNMGSEVSFTDNSHSDWHHITFKLQDTSITAIINEVTKTTTSSLFGSTGNQVAIITYSGSTGNDIFEFKNLIVKEL